MRPATPSHPPLKHASLVCDSSLLWGCADGDTMGPGYPTPPLPKPQLTPAILPLSHEGKAGLCDRYVIVYDSHQASLSFMKWKQDGYPGNKVWVTPWTYIEYWVSVYISQGWVLRDLRL